MKITKKYQKQLKTIYREIKLVTTTFFNKKTTSKEKKLAFDKFYDCAMAIKNLHDEYAGNDEFSTYEDNDYDEYRKRMLRKRGPLCGYDIRMMCMTMCPYIEMVQEIMMEAHYVGDVKGVLMRFKSANKPRWYSDEEYAEYIKNKEEEEAERIRLEEERKAWEEKKSIVDKPNDYENLVLFLQEYAEKKEFVNPSTGKTEFYYKFENKLFEQNGHRFGYAKIHEWNLIDEM